MSDLSREIYSPSNRSSKVKAYISDGGGGSWFWTDVSVTTRPHRTEALKQIEWVQTCRQLDEWGRVPSPGHADPPCPTTRFHIFNTMTATVILRPQRRPEGRLVCSPPIRRLVSLSYTCGGWYESGAMTALTVSSWVSGVERSGPVIARRYQNTNELWGGGKCATTVS